jgi:hypothetical protein
VGDGRGGEGGCASLGEPAGVFEPRVACGSQGERSSLASWQGQRDDAQEAASALGRPMRCGRRKKKDSLLNSVGGRPLKAWICPSMLGVD